MTREKMRRATDPRYAVINQEGYWLGDVDSGALWRSLRTDACEFDGPLPAWRAIAEFERDVWCLGGPRVVNTDPADGFPAVIEPCQACGETGRVPDTLDGGEHYCWSCSGYGVLAIWSLNAVQLHWGGLFDSRTHDGALHLVRNAVNGGCPGKLLCGFDFRARGEGQPGYSVGGGVSGPGIDRTPCAGCVAEAKRTFPGIPVTGTVQGDTIAEVVGVPVVDHWLPRHPDDADSLSARRTVGAEQRAARGGVRV